MSNHSHPEIKWLNSILHYMWAFKNQFETREEGKYKWKMRILHITMWIDEEIS